MSETFDFAKQMAMSHGVIGSIPIEELLLKQIVGSTGVRKADKADDKQGTDYFVDHIRGVPLSVDIKARKDDPIDEYGSDDLALETWSVVGVKKGWTIDESKRTDYILWLFATTKRYCLVPFHPLRLAAKRFGAKWYAKYKVARQPNHGYVSECMFVPRVVVWQAIFDVCNGNAAETSVAKPAPHHRPAPAQQSLFVNLDPGPSGLHGGRG